MKVLFINPYIYDFTAYDLWARPLGNLYLASVVKKYTNCEIFWIDLLDRFAAVQNKPRKPDGRGKYYREIVPKPPVYQNVPRNYARYGLPLDYFYDALNRIPSVELVFITSLMTYWIDGLTFTLDVLKKKFPRAKFVLGGLIPSLLPCEKVGDRVKVDFYVRGYGEEQILEIIAGEGGEIYAHPDLTDFRLLPYPAVEFLSSQTYLPLMTSRGCPYRCTYCASHILNKNFSQRNPAEVAAEIIHHFNKYQTRHFVLFDDALLVNKKEIFLKTFSKIRGEIKVNYHTPNGIHPREIDRETADLFYENCFKTLRLSFESINKKTLDKSSSKVTRKEMESAVQCLEKAGYKRNEIGAYLLFGAPWQNTGDIINSLKFTSDLGIRPHLAYFSPVPGTLDYDNLVRDGTITGDNLYESNKIYFLFEKSGFSPDDIYRVKNLANRINSPPEGN